MVIQIDWEVWVDDGEAKVGKIVEIKQEHVVIQTIHGVKIAVDVLKVRPLRELYERV